MFRLKSLKDFKMGWDLWIEIDAGGEHPATLGDSINHTHNCNDMLRKAGIYWPDHVGKTMEELEPILHRAITDMVTNRAEYEAMNPENGWGSYTTLLKVLRQIYAQCVPYKKAILAVSM